jgi:hypothetical protein
MENEFVTYEQAVALKELGFNEECLAYWNYHTQELNYNSHPSTFHSEDVIQLPLKQQVLRWFREKYVLFLKIEVFINNDDKLLFDFKIVDHSDDTDFYYDNDLYRTYEEQENEGINKLIEIAKQQENES